MFKQIIERFLPLLLMAIVQPGAFAQNSWQPLDGPYGGVVYSLEALNGLWYAGTGGGLYHSDDQGAHWQRSGWIPADLTVSSIEINPGEILIGAVAPSFDPLGLSDVNNLLYRSTDGGNSWQISLINTYFLAYNRHKICRSGNVLLAWSGEQLLRSTNDGQEWTVTDPGFSANSLQSNGPIALANNQWYGGAYSSDGGGAWTELNGPFLLPVFRFGLGNGNTILASGPNFPLYRSADLGQNWQEIGNPFGNNYFHHIERLDDGRLVAFFGQTGWDPTVHLSTDDGLSWTPFSVNPASVLFDFDAEGPSLGAGCGVGFFTNAGSAGDLAPSNTGLNNADIKALAAGDDWLWAGDGRGLWRSADGGDNWSFTNNNGQLNPTVQLLRRNDTLCALTQFSFLYSTDQGAQWTAPFDGGPPGPFIPFPAKRMALRGNQVLVGADAVFLSDNFGESWTAFNSAFAFEGISGVAFAGDQLFALAEENDERGIVRSADGGSNWELVYPLVGAGRMEYFNGRLFAFTPAGMVYSDDLGDSWSVPLGLPDYSQEFNLPYTVKALVAQDTLLYAALDYLGIYKSGDGGDSWQLFCGPPPNLRFSELAAADEMLYAASPYGGIWKYPTGTSATSQPASQQWFTLRPNPAVREICVQWPVETPRGNVQIAIFNPEGRPVATQNTDAAARSCCFSLDDCPDGAYRVSVRAGGQAWGDIFLKMSP